MQTKEIALAVLLVLSTVSATAYFLISEDTVEELSKDVLL